MALLVSILVLQLGVLFLMSEGVKVNQQYVLRVYVIIGLVYLFAHVFYGVR